MRQIDSASYGVTKNVAFTELLAIHYGDKGIHISSYVRNPCLRR